MKRNQRNAGFSMSELLFVMALIALFSAFGLVNIRAQKKNLDFMESNETAKEIFLSAQEHLATAYAQRELRDLDVALYQSLKVTDDLDDTRLGKQLSGNIYAIYSKNGEDVSHGPNTQATTLAYQTMAPAGAILTNQTFAIRYNHKTYRVLDTFYTTADYDFSGWTDATWNTHLNAIETQGESYLRDFVTEDGRKIVMGFYSETIVPGNAAPGGGTPGGRNPGDGTSPIDGMNLGLRVYNEEVLYALVTLDDRYDYSSVILKITELDDSGNPTGNSMSIPFATDDADGKLEWWRKKDSDYIVVLDDITRLDKDFKWLCAHFGSSITPGANIQITVEAKATYSGSSDVVEGVLENPVTCNSLFANGSSLSGAVLIRNFRHLQNLDECATVSSLTAELDTPVLGWDTFNLRIGQYRDDYFTPEQGETISLSAYSYSPVNPNYALTLQRTGSNLCTIQNLELPNLTNSGLLGELQYDATIQRIQMQDTTVAGSTNAGALIGAVKSGTIGIENIQLQNTAVAGSPTNAGGLIGNVEGGATTIQGVEAKNTTFTDSPTNAGGLIGKVAAGTGSVSVGQSASYGPNWTDGSVSYTGTTVTASQNAGGLIGKIESGSVTLTESAAAHLADAGTSGNAGGLVGGVTGGGLTIAYSYAASGQVIANGESIEYEYEGPATTRKLKGNIQGGNAGGLVGCVSGGTATLNNVYSTASAYGTTSAGDAATRYLVGAGSATITGDAYSSGDYQTASQAATGKNDAGAPLSATVGEDGRQEGSYYHQKLFGKKFPYKTVAMMGASSSAPWLSKHIGDWTPMENLPTANWGRDLNNTTKTVQYDDVRYAWIQVPDGVTLVDDTSVITLAVSNPNADADAEAAAAVLYAYKYKEAQAVAGTLAPWKHKSATDSAWMLSNEGPKMSKDANGPGLNASASGVWLRVTLDDITTAGNRFRDLYVSVNGSLSAEKPVSVRAGIGTVETEFNALRVGAGAITLNDWDGSNPKEYPNTGNVLFDIKDTAGNAAAITNIRHLQNLDASVSGVGTAIETATLEKDLNWTAIDNAEFGAWSAKSIQLDGRSTTNYFHGIRNESLTRFEGVGTSGKTLSGFVITGDATDKDAGLFRELTRDVTIEKLTLTGFQVTSATDGNAGALVASTEGDVTLRNVTLDNSGGAAVTAGTNGKAGGLIASARGATIENVTLRSPAVTATGTGAAAGLIASATGEVTIQNAASNANAVTLTSPVITAANGNAAGLIASASDRVTIVNNAASNANAVTLTNASVTATNGNAAGLVASATGSGTTATNVVLTDARVTTANGNAAGLVASATGAGSETTATKVALTDPIIRATATGAAAGLVASATGGVSATDVALTNASVTATGGDAGGLIASATGAVTAKNVTLGDSADADSQKAQISAGGTGAAAGLVVSAGSATIENVKLYSPKVEATGTSGAAAGLIASATGAAQIQNSASEANAVTLTGASVTAANGNAAGLIASASGGVKILNNATDKTAVTLTNPTVRATGTGDAAGLIASASGGAVTIQGVKLTNNDANAEIKAQSLGAAAGLIANASMTGASSVKDVEMDNLKVEATGRSAAPLISAAPKAAAGLIANATMAGGTAAVTIENVKLTYPNIKATENGAAAGLIASAQGSVTMQNSASNANAVTLTNPVITAENGAAAGLIASSTAGNVTIQNKASASDGNAVTLTNPEIKTTTGDAAGLVASATGNVTIQSNASDATAVALTSPDISTTTGDAAGLVASATGGVVTIQGVKLTNADAKVKEGGLGAAAGLIARATMAGASSVKNVDMDHLTVEARGKDAASGTPADPKAAAGLIAYATVTESATIENVKLTSPEIKTTTGAAAGLIASASGNVTIQNDASATDKTAVALTSPVITATTGNAGGLIASVASGSATIQNNVSKKDAFKLTNVKVTTGTGDAGGLIASVATGASATIQNTMNQSKSWSEYRADTLTLDNPNVSATDGAAAGLVASASGTVTAQAVRIQLQDNSVTAGTNGDAGGMVAIATGTVNADTVLVESKTQSVNASGTGAAGGLVGKLNGATLDANNSAASVYVAANGTGDAGGFVGTVANNGTATITNSYAGGHTGGGKYAGAVKNVWAKNGAAGGLVGSVASGASLTASQSFSATSVQGATAAGGVIGAGNGSATFGGPVYSAGPVANVSTQKKENNRSPELLTLTNEGAFVGAGDLRLNLTSEQTNAYYVPQVYQNAELYKWTNADQTTFKTSNIAYRGATGVSGSATPVGYADSDSVIAGTNHIPLLEQRTIHHDDATTNPDRDAEYPFAVWTKFAFDNDDDSETPYPYYYGDFEVVQNTPSVTVNVYFTYQLPGDGQTPQPVAEPDATGTSRPVFRTVSYSKDDGLRVIPASLPHEDGYAFDHWELSPGGEGGTSVRLKKAGQSDADAGQYDRLDITRNQIVVNAKYAEPSDGAAIITLNAVYGTDPNNRTVEYWSPDNPADPEHSTYALLASEKIKIGADATAWSELHPPTPARAGYEFAGFYDAKTGGALIAYETINGQMKFTSDAAIGASKNLYARFNPIEYFKVHVNFTYPKDDGTATYVKREFRYRVGDTGAQEFELLNTDAEIDKFYKGGAVISESYYNSATNKFNVKDALTDAEKSKDAETSFTILYVAQPVESKYYRVRYVLQHSVKSTATVSPPQPDYFKSTEVRAPADAAYSATETYPFFPQYDDDEIKLNNATDRVTLPVAGADETAQFNAAPTFSQADIPSPASLQGFTLIEGENSVVYLRADDYGEDDPLYSQYAKYKGTLADPYLVTYYYDRNVYTLAFNTSGGSNFDPPWTRMFGQPIDNASETMTRTAVTLNSDYTVTLLTDANGKAYEEPVEQTLANVVPYRQGYRLPDPNLPEEASSSFWQWKATVSNSSDATGGARVNLDRTASGLLMPASDMTAKAYFKEAPATYKIVVLQQRVNDDKNWGNDRKTYDQDTSVTVTSTTGAAPSDTVYAVTKNGVTTYFAQRPTSGSYTTVNYRNNSYTGFHYSRTENSSATVKADGSTIVTVYYDRTLKTIIFKRSNGNTYTTLTGLYGQTLAQNNYTWPTLSGYTWKDKDNYILTFLDAFNDSLLQSSDSMTLTQTRAFSNSAYFYKPALNGAYPATATNSGTTGDTLKLQEKYEPGFKLYGYNFNGNTASISLGENNQTVSLGRNKAIYVYYTRQSFTLSVSIDGTQVANISVPYETPLTSVAGIPTPTLLPEEVEQGYAYKYWCPDPNCVRNALKLSEETMPANNMALYAKKVPPTYYVKFELMSAQSNYPASEVNPTYEGGYGTTDQPPIAVTKDSNIDDDVTKPVSGGLKDPYSPQAGNANYAFDGWYYNDENGQSRKFYSSMAIAYDMVKNTSFNVWQPEKDEDGNAVTDDDGNAVMKEVEVKGLILYPKWTYIAEKSADVKIRCFYKSGNEKKYLPFTYNNGTQTLVSALDGQGRPTVTDTGVVNLNYQVNESKVLLTGDEYSLYRYKPGNLFARVVEDPSDNQNLVELQYVTNEWSYQLEYWVRLRNIAQKANERWLSAANFDTDVQCVPLPDATTWTSGALTSTAEPVALVTPRNADGSTNVSYSGYLVVGYRLATESGETIHPDSSVLLVPGDDRSAPVVVRVYLEADPTLMKLESRDFPYDGSPHARDLVVGAAGNEMRWDPEAGAWTEDAEKPDNLIPPDDVSYTAYRQYWDLTKDPPQSIQAPKDSGTYGETAYITATYAKGGVTKTYLLWKSADYDKSDSYLTVTPRNITLLSASATLGSADATSDDPLMARKVYILGSDPNTTGFVPTTVEIGADGQPQTKYLFGADFETLDDIETGSLTLPAPDNRAARRLTDNFVNQYVKFAVDAFRRNEGSTANIFEMKLPDEIAKNYNISKEYGTLKVE